MSYLLFIDFETTGTDPSLHEIVEIGAVLAGYGERKLTIIDAVGVLVLPEHIETAEPEALQINGYTPEGWEHAVPLAEGMRMLNKLVREVNRVTLVAHNAGFDVAFLKEAYRKIRGPWPKEFGYRILDTMSLAGPVWLNGFTTSASLDALCAHFGIQRPSPHRALDDAMCCVKITQIIMDKYR